MADLVRDWKRAVHDPEVKGLRARIAELEAKRMAIIRQIDAVVWNFERFTVTAEEHERAWRNVLAEAMK